MTSALIITALTAAYIAIFWIASRRVKSPPPKLFCKRHNTHAHPCIVCPHVMYDDAPVAHHVTAMQDGVCGQIVCDKTHSGPDELGRDPVLMCELCAEQWLP